MNERIPPTPQFPKFMTLRESLGWSCKRGLRQHLREYLVPCPPHPHCLWLLLQLQQCKIMTLRMSLRWSCEMMLEQSLRTMKTRPVITISPSHQQLWSTELYQVWKVQTVSNAQRIPHFLLTWGSQCSATCATGRSPARISSSTAKPTTTSRGPALDSTQWQSTLSRIPHIRTTGS